MLAELPRRLAVGLTYTSGALAPSGLGVGPSARQQPGHRGDLTSADEALMSGCVSRGTRRPLITVCTVCRSIGRIT